MCWGSVGADSTVQALSNLGRKHLIQAPVLHLEAGERVKGLCCKPFMLQTLRQIETSEQGEGYARRAQFSWGQKDKQPA